MQRPGGGGRQTRDRSKDTCHGCGGTGHYIRQCPYNRMVSKEAEGQPRNKVATLVPSLRTKEPVEVQWQDEAVEGILNDTLVTLHGVKSAAADAQGAVLGPTTTTTVLVARMTETWKPAKDRMEVAQKR